MDQLAAKAGKDPVQFRLALLKDKPRHAGVLKLAAEKAGWANPPPAGVFRGVAVHESFNTYVAEVAEISVTKAGAAKVERVVCAVDCGVAVNPDVIKAQMEGGIGFGLGAALRDAITMTGGVVDQANFDTYLPLRMSDMPKVEVHIVASTEPPTGVGEPGVPPRRPRGGQRSLQGDRQADFRAAAWPRPDRPRVGRAPAPMRRRLTLGPVTDPKVVGPNAGMARPVKAL